MPQPGPTTSREQDVAEAIGGTERSGPSHRERDWPSGVAREVPGEVANANRGPRASQVRSRRLTRSRWSVAGVLCVTLAAAWTGARAADPEAPRVTGADGATGRASPIATGALLRYERVLPYPVDLAWPTAIRYLRVDRGFEIADRDQDAGYILFEFEHGERKGRGSLELFATKDAAGRSASHVQVSTNLGPMHLPQAIVDGLSTKLKRERGQPPPPPPREPSEPPKDPKEPEPGPDPDDPGPFDPEDFD